MTYYKITLKSKDMMFCDHYTISGDSVRLFHSNGMTGLHVDDVSNIEEKVAELVNGKWVKS